MVFVLLSPSNPLVIQALTFWHRSPATHLQWIVLDGDIDAEWIESMNTVMDDNKMLTLASNERIPLTPTMRLLLGMCVIKQLHELGTWWVFEQLTNALNVQTECAGLNLPN
eukprot:1161047-Pelagomonas_calceolata.AAC.32